MVDVDLEDRGEGSGGVELQKGLQYGWIPRDPTKRPNGVSC